MEAALHPWPALGALLMRDGLVTREQLEIVLSEQSDSAHQRISSKRLGEALVERGIVTPAEIAQLVAEQYTLPFIELSASEIGIRAAVLLPEQLARRVSALPISVLPDGSLLVAIADPPLALFSDELHSTLGVPLRFAVATADAMDAAITFAFERARQLSSGGADESGYEPSDDPESVASANVAPAFDERQSPPIGLLRPWPALGALLVRDGIITDEDLDAALAEQKVSGSRRLGEILVERGSVTPEAVARLVAEQYEVPFLDLVASEIESEVAARLPEELARAHSAIPVSARDGEIVVALADPTKVLDAHELRSAFDLPVRFVAASPEAVESAIALVHATSGEDGETNVTLLTRSQEAHGERIEDETALQVETLEAEVEHAPGGGNELDELVERTVLLGASHVHFAPRPEGIAVRARVDGVMRDIATLTDGEAASAVARLKDLARLEAGQRRTPTEGRIALPLAGETVDLRLVVVQTQRGEKLTLTVRDPESRPRALTDLGLQPDDEQALRTALQEPSGAIVICGPAGSGRTTTLYAALRELSTPERSVTTIEYPVEHELVDVDQIEVSPEVGLTAARSLRAALRSDSDVVAVGEIADPEVAHLALEAAVGHLVLCTLEIQGTSAALRRLAHSSSTPEAAARAVACVLSQRLARRICTDCRETYYADGDELTGLARPAEEAGRRLLARGRGCEACGGTGYRGRVGLFEVLSVGPEIRALVDADASEHEIWAAARAAGGRTLDDEGIRLCLDGVTTVAEIRRVLGSRSL